MLLSYLTKLQVKASRRDWWFSNGNEWMASWVHIGFCLKVQSCKSLSHFESFWIFIHHTVPSGRLLIWHKNVFAVQAQTYSQNQRQLPRATRRTTVLQQMGWHPQSHPWSQHQVSLGSYEETEAREPVKSTEELWQVKKINKNMHKCTYKVNFV